ncbi:hypothetical protein LPJ38_09510 [Bradyrhizobium daqingense]|nr:hypothetical protein [Bradyrhizobium daqingense]UFS90939.1 hypothetical protein LPJ38_09510 [Bradyrhizobium daqingense]
MQKRRRFKQTTSLEERLNAEASRLRSEAQLMAPGKERERLLQQARQAETSVHMSEWLRSPGAMPSD